MPALGTLVRRGVCMDAENLFGRRLRELRDAVGLNQAELAERAGVVPANISRWESGDREPLVSQVRKLADALGVPAEELLKPPTSTPEAPRRGRPAKAKEEP